VIERPETLQVRAPMPRQEKITFGEMRASGASRIIVHCGDYKGSIVLKSEGMPPKCYGVGDVCARQMGRGP